MDYLTWADSTVPSQWLIDICDKFNVNCLLIIEIRKVLSKIAKENDCEEIQPWIRPCENHLSWSATSTSSGDGRVILAKFVSFLGHIVDKHENLDDPIFDRCAHGDIEQISNAL
jgi:hypothetical protein